MRKDYRHSDFIAQPLEGVESSAGFKASMPIPYAQLGRFELDCRVREVV